MKTIDYIGEEKLNLGKEWLAQSKRNPLFLTGPTSCGKSTYVRTLLKDYILCEDDIDDLKMNVTRKSLLKIACVIDCIEQFQNIDILIEISKTKISVPVIFIADDAYDKKYVELRKNCHWILLKREDPKKIIDKILQTNGIHSFDYSSFLIASNNNVRQTLNQFFFYLNFDEEEFNIDNAIMDFEQDKFEETKQILNGISKTTTTNENDENTEENEILFMLHENAASSATNILKSSKINDIMSFNDCKNNYNDYILRLGISNEFKGFSKVTKLRFPTYYTLFKTNKLSKFKDSFD